MRGWIAALALAALAQPSARQDIGTTAQPAGRITTWDAAGRVAVVVDQDSPVQLQGGSAQTLDSPLALLARNLSGKRVSSVIVAAVAPASAQRGPADVRVLKSRSVGISNKQGEFFLLTTELVSEKAIKSIPRGTVARIGVTGVVFADGTKWAYDVLGRGGFSSVTAEARARNLTSVPLYKPGTIGCQNPTPLYSMDPKYPFAAQDRLIQGDVDIDATVRSNGTVGDLVVTRSLDTQYGLDQQAIAAVRGWLFDPARCNGSPVAMVVGVSIEFRLHRLEANGQERR
jgi:TonB family protein